MLLSWGDVVVLFVVCLPFPYTFLTASFIHISFIFRQHFDCHVYSHTLRHTQTHNKMFVYFSIVALLYFFILWIGYDFMWHMSNFIHIFMYIFLFLFFEYDKKSEWLYVEVGKMAHHHHHRQVFVTSICRRKKVNALLFYIIFYSILFNLYLFNFSIYFVYHFWLLFRTYGSYAVVSLYSPKINMAYINSGVLLCA